MGEGRQGGGKKSKKGERKRRRNGVAAEEPGARETGRATICPRVTPVSAARATTGPTCVSREAKPEPAAAEGDVDGERAEDAGYDSTLLVVIGILVDIEEQSMDTHQRPLGAHAPAHLAGDHTRDLISKRPLPSCPSSSLQTPTKDQDQPDPLMKMGTLQTQPRTRIQASAGTRRSARELVHAYLVC